jgi:hypothetical protein
MEGTMSTTALPTGRPSGLQGRRLSTPAFVAIISVVLVMLATAAFFYVRSLSPATSTTPAAPAVQSGSDDASRWDDHGPHSHPKAVPLFTATAVVPKGGVDPQLHKYGTAVRDEGNAASAQTGIRAHGPN